MKPVRETVEIKVELFRDQDGSYFVAASDELGLVTDGETFEELLRNLGEALELCLEDATELDILPNPPLQAPLCSPPAPLSACGEGEARSPLAGLVPGVR